MMLGRRFGSVVPLGTGSVELGTRRGKNPAVKSMQLDWSVRHSSEMAHPYHDIWQSPIEIPTGASDVQAPSTAYLLKAKNRKSIGFLRIPSFFIERKDYEKTMEAFSRTLAELQQRSDVLVLDVTFNDGGDVEYAAALLALLMESDFTPNQYRLLASEDELKYWQSVRAAQKTNEIKEKFNFIIAQIKEALARGDRLTKPASFSGAASSPGRGIYTKPIVLLVNEFTASAADVFSVYMKDLNRATLVGQTTMCGGTHARDSLTLPVTGIRVKVPKVLFCRPDGTAFENVGAVPDREYSIRAQEDLLQRYSGLREFALEVAESLVREESNNN